MFRSTPDRPRRVVRSDQRLHIHPTPIALAPVDPLQPRFRHAIVCTNHPRFASNFSQLLTAGINPDFSHNSPARGGFRSTQIQRTPLIMGRMIRFARLLAICAFAAALPAQSIQTPENFSDFTSAPTGSSPAMTKSSTIFALADRSIASASATVGPTTQGNPFVILEISSPENIRNLDHLKQLRAQTLFPGRRTHRRRARPDLSATANPSS